MGFFYLTEEPNLGTKFLLNPFTLVKGDFMKLFIALFPGKEMVFECCL